MQRPEESDGHVFISVSRLSSRRRTGTVGGVIQGRFSVGYSLKPAMMGIQPEAYDLPRLGIVTSWAIMRHPVIRINPLDPPQTTADRLAEEEAPARKGFGAAGGLPPSIVGSWHGAAIAGAAEPARARGPAGRSNAPA